MLWWRWWGRNNMQSFWCWIRSQIDIYFHFFFQDEFDPFKGSRQQHRWGKKPNCLSTPNESTSFLNPSRVFADIWVNQFKFNLPKVLLKTLLMLMLTTVVFYTGLPLFQTMRTCHPYVFIKAKVCLCVCQANKKHKLSLSSYVYIHRIISCCYKAE